MSYLVMVTSQRSESDALKAFSAVQARFPTVMGGRPPIIRRADLGGKGIYFRSGIGPIRTREEAIELCSRLKTLGGDCVVQSN